MSVANASSNPFGESIKRDTNDGFISRILNPGLPFIFSRFLPFRRHSLPLLIGTWPVDRSYCFFNIRFTFYPHKSVSSCFLDTSGGLYEPASVRYEHLKMALGLAR